MWQFKCSFTNQNCEKKINKWSWFYVSSLWDDTVPAPPRSVHLPLPADVIPWCGHVLHRPPAPTASVRGAGSCFGCLPAAHETASVGMLDMADHAVTETNHRWRHGASFIVFFCFFQTRLLSYLGRSPGLQTPQPFGKALYTVCGVEPLSQWKREKCVIPEICSFHVCMYICNKVVGMPLLI